VSTKVRVSGLAIAALAVVASFALLDARRRELSILPYDYSNPVVYDNDEAVDMYTDEYLLGLASLGKIRLDGMITSSSVAPYNRYVTVNNYERCVSDREELLANARASNLLNVPNSVRGPMGNLQKPASGRIEDTRSIPAAGAFLIVAKARQASREKPLIVVAGAPLTAEADAYLIDPGIADKVIVAWLGGQVIHPWMGSYSRMNLCEYNGWGDPWAAYIVIQKLRLVEFPVNVALPSVPKQKILELPPSPLRDYMYKKHHPTNSDPRDVDGDGPPAISVMRSDYPLSIRRVAFKTWVPCNGHDVPEFISTHEGRVWFVLRSDQHVATAEWWQTMRQALSQ
jgi:hypothetical protein